VIMARTAKTAMPTFFEDAITKARCVPQGLLERGGSRRMRYTMAVQAPALKRIVLKDRVAELVRDAILCGKLDPGDRIVEMKLAADLGVGTTAVREALFELVSQGFVSRITNKGTFVTQLTAEDVEQIQRVRRSLEGLAVELAQARAHESDFEDLDHALAEMRKGAKAGDVFGFYRADLEFHRAIWRISGNKFLSRSLDLLVPPLFAFFIMRTQAGSEDDLLVSVDRHSDITRAMRSGENARSCMDTSLQFFLQQEQRMLFGESY
jgi:DNA-binding GntR family transcriptional regulator